ncbi:glycoside hydrolase family 1 protein [Zasmidium cellare ATCC 36951]|uniref:Glycoside hydrolase family 1 protein n=1 Tax=Zasmidium cellare ATCC 36951 TaxID=1080233 RepID=A0A6A6CJ19_ZASCE|nr:glycoside hydrolase family 1 protein [Zasmidium cellare ATCC 36951]KAF2165689.1 glycoside hydrolase family 1 protein [Zasmidium cellare ATCC 36951]
MPPTKLLLPLLATLTTAQTFTESIAPSLTAANGTQIPNPTLLATTLAINVEDYWNLRIGPVQEAATTTTVSPTPIPSTELIPPPPLYYAPFPTGQQVFQTPKNESWSFPKDFWWGVAGAAQQIEGGVKAEGRGPSIWDKLPHVPNYVVNNYTSDVADNNYYLYKQDIARIAALGVKVYSFSLSWSRILPFGKGPVNQLAIDHYNDLIDTCIEYGVTPMITLYHWDLPLYLQDTYGGWLSPSIVADFVAYARIAYTAFGDRVSHWFTVNEPIVFCGFYPLPTQHFPNFTIPNLHQRYWCGHHVLLAHAQAYHLGKALLGANSTIALKHNGGYKIPLTNSSADAEAVQRAWDFNEGWFSDPVFLTGDYPVSLKAFVRGFLPEFSDEEKGMINGSADIYAHDAYTAQFYFAPEEGIEACVQNPSNPLYPTCANTSYTYAPTSGSWLIGPAADPGSPWLHTATPYLPSFLHYMQSTWKPRGGIAITEFGFAEPFESRKTLLQDILYDPVRSAYYRSYMEGVLAAMSEGVRVVGTLAWSFVDNYEWAQGYSVTFGMQYVNFSDPALPRRFKASFFEYVNVFEVYQEK